MKQENKAAFKFILSYLKNYFPFIISGLFCIIAATALQTISPLFLGAAIDYISSQESGSIDKIPQALQNILFIENNTGATLFRLAVMLLVVAAGLALFRTLWRLLIAHTSRHVDYDMRNDYMKHLQKMSQRFFQENKTGDLMACATNDMRAMQRVTGFGFAQTFSTFLMFLFALNFMFQISVSLTLLALAPLPLIIIIMYSALGKLHKLFDYIQKQFATLTSKAQENFSGIRVIKSYGRSEWEIKSFREENLKYIKRNIDEVKLDALLEGSLKLLLGLSTIVVIWYGGKQIMLEKLSIGELVALFSYVIMLAWPMESIGWLLQMWQKGITAALRVQHVMNTPADIIDSELTDYSIVELDGSVQFNNVSFTYPGALKPALENITFEVKKGQTIAVVGATGAGKSTLIHLLPRLLEPTQGDIKIGGYDIKSIPLEILRQNIGMVQQESFLFSDTLSGNISFGVTDVDEKLVDRAAKVSQLELDIDQFPEGLQTVIGERGITLSGGQKQRTSISRAIIRNPALLILDDALSAVDTYTEEEILNQIRPVMKNCTTIIVAHRISTIRTADLILVLDEGKIAERGNHFQLLRRQGLYFQMHERQVLEQNLKNMN